MDLIHRTRDAVKEFDNIRYRRMKKVFLDQDEQLSLNASQSSVPNATLVESNELILMDFDQSKNVSYQNFDDEDSRCTDFNSDSQQIDADEDEDETSFNSSQSSLQQPPTSLLIGRQMSNPPLTSDFHPQLANFDTTNPSCFQPLEIHIDQISNESSQAIPFNEFSTIKTSKIVFREQRQHDQDEEQREQLRGYKQMRRQHQKQLKQVQQSISFQRQT